MAIKVKITGDDRYTIKPTEPAKIKVVLSDSEITVKVNPHFDVNISLADLVTVDTSEFDTNLSSADDTVQKALDTLDDLVASSTGLPSGGTIHQGLHKDSSDDGDASWTDFPFRLAEWFDDGILTDRQILLAAFTYGSTNKIPIILGNRSWSVGGAIPIVSDTHIYGQGKGVSTITLANGSATSNGIIYTAAYGYSNIIIEGLDIDGNRANTTGSYPGIAIFGGKYCKICRNYITGTSSHGIAFKSDENISEAYINRNNEIEFNEIEDVAGSGIFVAQDYGGSIKNNEITSCAGACIFIYNGDASTAESTYRSIGTKIDNNRLDNSVAPTGESNHFACIAYPDGSQGLEITNNTCLGSDDDSILLHQTGTGNQFGDVLIQGNEVSDSGLYGIDLCSGARCLGNTIRRTLGSGIVVVQDLTGDYNDIVIANNLIVDVNSNNEVSSERWSVCGIYIGGPVADAAVNFDNIKIYGNTVKEEDTSFMEYAIGLDDDNDSAHVITFSNIQIHDNTLVAGDSGPLYYNPTNTTDLVVYANHGLDDINFHAWPSLTDGYVPYDNSGIGTNSNLYYDDVNLRYGIGTIIPTAAIHVEGSNFFTSSIKAIWSGSPSATSGAGLVLGSNDGTTEQADGDRLGYTLFAGWRTASQLNNSAGIVAYADGAWSEGNYYPAKFIFETADISSGTSRVERLFISTKIGAGALATNAQLESTPITTTEPAIQATGITSYTGDYYRAENVGGDVLYRVNDSGYVGVGVDFDPSSAIVAYGAGAGMQIKSIATGTYGAGSGGGYFATADSGVANGIDAADVRLGYFLFGGAKDASGTIENACGIVGYTTEAWYSTGTHGAKFQFETNSVGTTARTKKLTVGDLISIHVCPIYTNNAAAKTGGLVDDDVYRTSTGQLMIVYT